MLTTNISITKQKELSEMKKLLDDTIHDFNIKLLNKDNIFKEALDNFEK